MVAYPCCGPTVSRRSSLGIWAAFSKHPKRSCGQAEKIGFRLGGAVSTKINASYFLQTALVRFADGKREYNHT